LEYTTLNNYNTTIAAAYLILWYLPGRIRETWWPLYRQSNNNDISNQHKSKLSSSSSSLYFICISNSNTIYSAKYRII